MPIQYLTDVKGEHTAVLIPINEWELIIRKHEDLRNLENIVGKSYKNLSGLAGKLSNNTANAMLDYVIESRKEWEERLK